MPLWGGGSYILPGIQCLHTVKWLNNSIWPQDRTLTVRVDLGVMTMKGYSTLHKAQGLEPHSQTQFSVIPRTLVYLIHRWDPNKYYYCVSGYGSNGNEGVLHIPQSSSNRASALDVV